LGSSMSSTASVAWRRTASSSIPCSGSASVRGACHRRRVDENAVYRT
jgi:hypothetical protein